ncbi:MULTISPECIES: tetratricopeptide repeat protein [unclassified Saccharicrinis]|uniref:tetratricopeptide repeat protein n=1 Tax=unclassified Saccharicrinis TaxID=2646859 RepID=UPI003D32E24B
MDISNIKSQQIEVEKALAEKRVKEALSVLGKLTTTYHGGNLIDEHYNLEFTYKSMLKYTVEGVNDPERQKVYNNIVSSCYHLSDKLFSSINNIHSSGIFFETRRKIKTEESNGLKELIQSFYGELTQQRMSEQADIGSDIENRAALLIFNKLWVTEELSNDEVSEIKKLIHDASIHFSYRSIFISALTIGLLKEFCLEKILLMFDFANHPENELKQRGITGLLLTLYKYDSRTNLYPEISARLSLLEDNKGLIDNFISITVQLIRTRETEKISKKLTDEIIPEVVKMRPNLRNKLDLDNMLGEKFNEGENPEWEDFFKDSPELMSKLEELTELQMEGADVFLNTFKMLKHFSFFNSVSNWLVPFYVENSELKATLKDESHIFSSKAVQDSLTNSGFLCNSDKYSLFLSIPHMPQFQKEMMGNMLQQQLEQMNEIEKDEKMVKAGKENSIISNRYIQDLYRFYKLHPLHSQFEDVFSWKMDFHNKWFFNKIVSNTNGLRQIAEFFFKKEYFKEASEAFELIVKQDVENIEVIQKLAYCHQQQKAYNKALNNYLKADILKPEQVWTTKKIALIYKFLKNPEKALEYYHIAERLKPEDLHTQASIGHCHLDLKDYSQALKYYFKVEYLDQSNTKVWRPIAWCSFVTGNFDQAEKYYQKLLTSNSGTHDLINIGHVCWCKNNRKEALKFYQKAILQMKKVEEFFETFNEDIPVLLKNGIYKEDIPMMLDQLKYLLEE